MDHFKPLPFPSALSNQHLQRPASPVSSLWQEERDRCGREKEPLAPSIEDRRNKAHPGFETHFPQKRSCPKCCPWGGIRNAFCLFSGWKPQEYLHMSTYNGKIPCKSHFWGYTFPQAQDHFPPLFKKVFFSTFYFQTRSTSSSKSGGLSASFAALGICNSARSVWHAAPGYAKFNWNWELKIPCSNELRGALKFLYSSSLQPGQRALTILPLSYLLQHERNKHFPCPKIQPKSHLGGKN